MSYGPMSQGPFENQINVGYPEPEFPRLRKARRIFGIDTGTRGFKAALGGLANMPQATPEGFGANLLSGLAGGLRGSLVAGQAYDEQQAEMEQQAQAQAMAQARLDQGARSASETERHNRAVEQQGVSSGRSPFTQIPWFMDTASPFYGSEEAKRLRAALGVDDPSTSRDPVDTALRTAEMKRQHPDLFPEADPLMSTETEVLERDLMGYPSRTVNRRVRESDTGIPKGFKPRTAGAYSMQTGKPMSQDELDILEMTDLKLLQAISLDPQATPEERVAASQRLAQLSR